MARVLEEITCSALLLGLALSGCVGDGADRRAPRAGGPTLSRPSDAGAPRAAAQLTAASEVTRDRPPFRVVRATPHDASENFPCSDCHDEDQPPNPAVRTLEEEHKEIALAHGEGRFWCLRCHDADNRDVLADPQGRPIELGQSYLLCGGCHARQQKDFFFGAHGKRTGSFQGERVLTHCIDCHDPHAPAIRPRKPAAPPRPREGFAPTGVSSRHPSAWEKRAPTKQSEK